MKQEKTKRPLARGAAVLAIAALLLAADQEIKRLVLASLKPVGTVTVIPGWLELCYLENTGAAFGLFKNQIWLVAAVSVAAFAVITVLLFRYRNHTFFSYAASALLLAGGIGNLLDRVFYGYVVDFIHVMFFDYVFNFADCCITVGSALFVIHVLLLAYREKWTEQPEDELPEDKTPEDGSPEDGGE